MRKKIETTSSKTMVAANMQAHFDLLVRCLEGAVSQRQLSLKQEGNLMRLFDSLAKLAEDNNEQPAAFNPHVGLHWWTENPSSQKREELCNRLLVDAGAQFFPAGILHPQLQQAINSKDPATLDEIYRIFGAEKFHKFLLIAYVFAQVQDSDPYKDKDSFPKYLKLQAEQGAFLEKIAEKISALPNLNPETLQKNFGKPKAPSSDSTPKAEPSTALSLDPTPADPSSKSAPLRKTEWIKIKLGELQMIKALADAFQTLSRRLGKECEEQSDKPVPAEALAAAQELSSIVANLEKRNNEYYAPTVAITKLAMLAADASGDNKNKAPEKEIPAILAVLQKKLKDDWKWLKAHTPEERKVRGMQKEFNNFNPAQSAADQESGKPNSLRT